MIAEVLFCLFLCCIAVQYGYLFYFFHHIFSIPGKDYSNYNPKPVSIIICAKNEAKNLGNNLPAILAQRYSNDAGNLMFEVVVVNDGSYDDTLTVLETFSKQYPHLRYISIPADADRALPGKKAALGVGIDNAANDLLLLTDADCIPASANWLAKMVAPLHFGRSVVAGYGKYHAQEGMLNSFIRWETMHTFLQYSSYALAGRPYMAVGRNMACTKAAFAAASRSDAWAKLPSGDDDLLVNAVGDKYSMAIVADDDAFTISGAKDNLKDWMLQKQRHLSTGKYYRGGTIMLVGGYAVIHALCWLLFIALLFAGKAQEALFAMLLRSVPYWLVWYEAKSKLKEKQLVLLFPLMDIGWMIYNFAFSPYVFWKNKKQWK